LFPSQYLKERLMVLCQERLGSPSERRSDMLIGSLAKFYD
jgi:hypothetical protein